MSSYRIDWGAWCREHEKISKHSLKDDRIRSKGFNWKEKASYKSIGGKCT